MTAAPRRGVNPVVFGAGVWAGVIVSPRTMGSLASSVLLVPVRRALGRSTAASMLAWIGRVSWAARCGLDGLVVLGRGDGVGPLRALLFVFFLLPGLGAEIRVLGSLAGSSGSTPTRGNPASSAAYQCWLELAKRRAAARCEH